jgi:dethiobiotin synthetase
MAGIVVTGTDTGVGKTFFSCLLLKALRDEGVDAIGYKPVSCGSREDAEALVEASGRVETIDLVNPVHLNAPAAPMVAAELQNEKVDLRDLVSHAEALAARHEVVVVEGVGGWEVPMAPGETFADFAVMLGWPVVLVVANKLGAMNHTLLSAGAIRNRGLPLAGLVLNHLEEERDVAMVTNKSVLVDWVNPPCWTELMPGQDWLDEGLAEAMVGKSGG